MKHIIVSTVVAYFLVSTCASAQDTFHVFPQIADGAFSDGTSYKSALMIRPAFSSSPVDCTFRLYGLNVTITNPAGTSGPFSLFTITMAANGWFFARTTGTQPFRAGYATLTCSTYVYAEMLYSLYSGPIKLGEATVFSSDDEYSVRLIADQTENARIGIAIANNTDIARTYRLTATNYAGVVVGTTTFSIPLRTAQAKFLDEMISGTSGQLLIVAISPTEFSPFSAIGLRFTGTVFTTIPAN